MRHTLWMLPAMAGVLAAPLTAQPSPEVLPGPRVRVMVPEQYHGAFVPGTGRWQTGILVSADSGSVGILLDRPGGLFEVPLTAVQYLQVSRGLQGRGNVALRAGRKGGLLGAGIALALATFPRMIFGAPGDGPDGACSLDCEIAAPTSGRILRNAAIGASTGALLGYFVGSSRQEHWEAVPRRDLSTLLRDPRVPLPAPPAAAADPGVERCEGAHDGVCRTLGASDSATRAGVERSQAAVRRSAYARDALAVLTRSYTDRATSLRLQAAEARAAGLTARADELAAEAEAAFRSAAATAERLLEIDPNNLEALDWLEEALEATRQPERVRAVRVRRSETWIAVDGLELGGAGEGTVLRGRATARSRRARDATPIIEVRFFAEDGSELGTVSQAVALEGAGPTGFAVSAPEGARPAGYAYRVLLARD